MRRLVPLAAVAICAACGGSGDQERPAHRVRVPVGASFGQVADSLARYDVVRAPRLFRLYGRVAGVTGKIKAGTYEFREGAGWREVLDDLVAGRIASDRLVVPEGWEARHIAPSLARILDMDPDSLFAYMMDTATARRFEVPGPTLEGYLFPATYVVPAGTHPDTVLLRMVQQYQRMWTADRRARADSARLSEREVTTLASIVEREARVPEEMPLIAAVFRNRLAIGYPLQADPTIQYALGQHQTRLLHAHIDSVANHPYNTYRRPGIPPGPIGSPSARAIDAVLDPADVDYLYFVARPDGTHEFNRHLVDHNRARARLQRERRAAAAAAAAAAARAAADTLQRDTGRPGASTPPAPGRDPMPDGNPTTRADPRSRP